MELNTPSNGSSLAQTYNSEAEPAIPAAPSAVGVVRKPKPATEFKGTTRGQFWAWTWPQINFWLDALLLLLLMAVLWSALVLCLVFPPPANAIGWTVCGGSLSAWLQLHVTTLALFTLGVLLHLILHWSWVCAMLAGWLNRTWGVRKERWDNGTETLIGVSVLMGVLITLTAAVLVTAWQTKVPSAGWGN